MKAFEKAFEEAFDQKRPLPPPGEASDFLNEYFNVRLPVENLRASEAWLAKVERTTPGIQRTESGLLYRIVDPGSPLRATHDEDRVTALCKAKLCDGRIVDPLCGLTLRCALVYAIPGWTEGLKLVGKGGKIELWLHPDLAYGMAEHVVSELGLAPNTALYFEMEVLDVIPMEEGPWSVKEPAARSIVRPEEGGSMGTVVPQRITDRPPPPELLIHP